MDTCVSDKLSGTCRWIEQPAVYDQPATERASEDTVNIQPDVPVDDCFVFRMNVTKYIALV